jgi:Kef-type K+ transport system membrane component KefB/nucleotide-binding universal stress UspA family protein
VKLAAISRHAAWAAAAALLPCLALAAEAQGEGEKHPSELIFVAEIAILILVGRLLGELMQRIGQPSVIGQLVGGLLLGPSFLGLIWPEAQHALFPSEPAQRAMIDAVSQLGILLLLLLTGMETDIQLVRKVGSASVSVSLAGVILPFACGFALGEFMPAAMLPNPDQRLITSLFLGTAMSIASVKIVAMVVREMNFMRRNLGQIILSSAIIDDTTGWVIIAIVLGLARHGSIDIPALAQSVLGTAIFLGLAFTVGRVAMFKLIRWSNDHLVSEVPIISVVLLVMIGLALLTNAIGVHFVLGAFVAGILVGESPIRTRQIDQQLRGVVTGLFAPVFFGMAGLSADLTILKDPKLVLFTAALVVMASIGKAAGAFIGGKFGGLTMRESFALACGMNARGSTEVIVATIGLSMGVLSHDLFTMIVAMAVITTMVMPPTLRWALSRVPMRKEEKERLEREEFESKSFMANVERLLLAVDESDNGKYASRLAGLLAGARGIPTTVLQIEARPSRQQNGGEKKEDRPEAQVKEGAKTSSANEPHEEAEPRKVEIVTRKQALPPEEAVKEEARRGYDLLLIGLDKPVLPKGGFRKQIAQAAAGFNGPIGIVVGQGEDLEERSSGPRKILLPTTGTDVARRAAEVAVALARSTEAELTAVHVVDRGDASGNGGPSRAAARRFRQAILSDVTELAERYEVEAKTLVRYAKIPENTILKVARDGDFDLIVMGVNRRPGEELFFGHVAAKVLEKTKSSTLIVSGAATTGGEAAAGGNGGSE